MSMTLQEIKDSIVFHEREDAGLRLTFLRGVFMVSETVPYDHSYPVKEIAKDRVVGKIMDKLFQHRYQEVAKAMRIFLQKLSIDSPELIQDFLAMRNEILKGDTEIPPDGYKPSQES